MILRFYFTLYDFLLMRNRSPPRPSDGGDAYYLRKKFFLSLFHIDYANSERI